MADCGNPLKLIGFAADDFYTLEAESEAFARWLASSNSPVELMAALAPSLRARVVADPPEREVLRQLPEGEVITATDLRTFQGMVLFGFGVRSRSRAISYPLANLLTQRCSLPSTPGIPSD